MAVAGVATANYNSVSPALKRTKHEGGIEAAGARDTDYLDVCGIAHSSRARKVRARIAAPVAAERDYCRLPFIVYLHIASTSDII